MTRKYETFERELDLLDQKFSVHDFVNGKRKTAASVGADAAAKSDSAKESISSVNENREDVKPRSRIAAEIVPDGDRDCELRLQVQINGPEGDLLLMLGALVSCCIIAAHENGIDLKAAYEVINKGRITAAKEIKARAAKA